ncbi:hypothetical protein SRABI106_03173 [Rahnella aquatilis]|nr:hypothetical protein SRABI106_03173 [Rahnella aquatilis]
MHVRHHAFLLTLLIHLIRNVMRDFDDFYHFAVIIYHRVIARLQPDRLTVASDALKTAKDKFTVSQTLPVIAVLVGITVLRDTKHRVGMALNLLQRITHDFQEVIVRRNHMTFRCKGNQRH